MTATHNSRAAADQGRTTYRAATAQLGHLGLDTAVPEGVRALAEKTIARSREAYDGSKDAFDASLTAFETSFDAAGQGAAAFNRKLVDIARRNVDASFDLATSSRGRQDLIRNVGAAGGVLAQAARRIDGASRGSSRAVGQGNGRYGRTDQGTNGPTASVSSSRTVDVMRRRCARPIRPSRSIGPSI